MPEATENAARHRYEMIVDGETAFVTCVHQGSRLVLKHTEVPKALAGRGIGSALASSVLEDIRRRGLLIVPECEFIAAFIERHPTFADLVGDPKTAP